MNPMILTESFVEFGLADSLQATRGTDHRTRSRSYHSLISAERAAVASTRRGERNGESGEIRAREGHRRPVEQRTRASKRNDQRHGKRVEDRAPRKRPRYTGGSGKNEGIGRAAGEKREGKGEALTERETEGKGERRGEKERRGETHGCTKLPQRD